MQANATGYPWRFTKIKSSYAGPISDMDPLAAQWSFDQARLTNQKPVICPQRPLVTHDRPKAPDIAAPRVQQPTARVPNHAFDEATFHHAVFDLPPICPWAGASRAAVLHHHSPPIGHQVRGAHALDRVSRAKDREPAARRAAPGAKQEGNMVQESAPTE